MSKSIDASTQLINESLSEAQRSVLLACANAKHSGWIHVKPLGRYGYTGAQLFQARFDSEGTGIPFVIKVNVTKEIKRELDAIVKAQTYFQDANSAQHVKPRPANGFAALIYPQIINEDDEIEELRDLYTADDVADDQVCQILRSVYTEKCKYAHQAIETSVRLGKEYAWYERPKRPDRISETFPNTKEPIFLFGNTYSHPAQIKTAIASQEIPVPHRFAHGDLHPNNIVFGRGRAPALIDFAWAHEGDITKDFVLMECSLRLLLFPRNISWSDHHWVSQAMVNEDGPEQVIDRYSHDTDSVPHSARYLRMARTVKVVREEAKRAAGDLFSFSHYLAGQFLVLYGLSRMPVYPFLETVDTLGLIAEALDP